MAAHARLGTMVLKPGKQKQSRISLLSEDVEDGSEAT